MKKGTFQFLFHTFNHLNIRKPVVDRFSDVDVALFSTLAYSQYYKFYTKKVNFKDKKVDGFKEEYKGNSSLYYKSDIAEAVAVKMESEKLFFYVPLVEDTTKVTYKEIQTAISSLYLQPIRLTAPYFKVSTDYDLDDLTKSETMGLNYIYTNKGAFNKVDESLSCFVSKIKQKNTFQLSKYGIDAASVTVIEGCGATAPPEYIDVFIDRPFYFALLDSHNLPLFVGHIENI